MGLRNIQVGDDLSGKTLYFQWPETLTSGTAYSELIKGTYVWASINQTSTGTVWMYNGSPETVQLLSLESIVVSSRFGVVTSINADAPAYQYIFIDMPIVTFKDDDGTVMKEEEVEPGGSATPPDDPTKAATAQYEYKFAGWSGNYTTVTQDETVIATYTETLREYKITWKFGISGQNQDSGNYPYGTIPCRKYKKTNYDEDDVVNSSWIYKFSGWSPSIEPVTGEATYTAVYTRTKIDKSLAKYGRTIDLSITDTAESKSIHASNIDSFNITFDGGLLTTVMRQADIELEGLSDIYGITNIEIANAMNGKPLAAKLSVTGDTTEEKDFGTFIVNEAKACDDTNSIQITAYDKMLLFMVPYSTVADFSQTVTLGSYLQAICDYIGVTLATPVFVNSNVEVDGEKYDSSYTFRDVLGEIAQAAGGTIAIRDDSVYVLYQRNSGITVEPSGLKSLDVGKKYGPVNSVVLSRTPQEDNIYKRDESADDICELKIENNQIMDSHREDFLDGIYGAVNGLYYYLYEVESYGICTLDVMDLFTLETLDGNQYQCMWLNSNLEITQGIAESSKVEAPEETETDYTAASETDRRINKTILRVDKQENEIQALASETHQRTNELTGQLEAVTRSVEQAITPEALEIRITEAIEGIDSITTATGYTFDAEGLHINKSGEEMENLLDHTGMYVNRDSENILTANNEGVDAINLKARQYLIVGHNSRFEDYEETRTACFYIG